MLTNQTQFGPPGQIGVTFLILRFLLSLSLPVKPDTNILP
jgi:hypothetical protein